MKTKILLAFLLTATALAQVSPPSTQSRVAGRFVAWNYGQWAIPLYTAPAGTGSQTFTLVSSQVRMADGRTIMPFNTNAVIFVGKEQVTVTAVGSGCINAQVGPGKCVLTATFSNKHTNAEVVSSATYGLQEALNDAGASSGGTVTVDSAWAGLGGTTGMVNAATLPANTGIEDERTGSGTSGSALICTGTAPNQTCTVGTLAATQGVVTKPKTGILQTAGYYLVGAGDSRIAGGTLGPGQDLMTQISLRPQFINMHIINGAFGGATCASMTTAYSTSIAPYAPHTTGIGAYLLIGNGLNDIRTSIPFATWSACYQAYLNTAVAAGFVPIIATNYPDNNGSVSTDQTRQTWNLWLKNLPYFVWDTEKVLPDTTASTLYSICASASQNGSPCTTSSTVTATSTSAGVTTFTGSNSWTAAQTVYLGSFLNSPCLNNTNITISATGLSGSSWQATTNCPSTMATDTGYAELFSTSSNQHANGQGVQLLADDFNFEWGVAFSGTKSYPTWQQDYFNSPSGVETSGNPWSAPVYIVTGSTAGCANPITGIFDTDSSDATRLISCGSGVGTQGTFSFISQTSNNSSGIDLLDLTTTTATFHRPATMPYLIGTSSTSGSPGANTFVVDQTGSSQMRAVSYGAGTSTQGTFTFVSQTSNNSNGINLFDFANTGNISHEAIGFTGTLTSFANNSGGLETSGGVTYLDSMAGSGTKGSFVFRTVPGGGGGATNALTLSATGDAVFNGGVSPGSSRKGTFTCTSGGSIAVTNANGSTTSDIIITLNAIGGTLTWNPRVSVPPNGTQFTVLCASLDTATYNYDILN